MFATKRFLLLLACVGLFQGCAAGVGVLTLSAITGTAGSMYYDRRTMDIQSQDTEIEQRLRAMLDQDAALIQGGRITPHIYNRLVLLTGEAYSSTAQQRAGELARSLPHVRLVYNQVRLVSPATDTRSIQEQDFYTTARIKAVLTGKTGMGVVHTLVTTDKGMTYLMGMLTREEAQAVIDIVRTVEGVRGVTPLFEYVRIVPAS